MRRPSLLVVGVFGQAERVAIFKQHQAITTTNTTMEDIKVEMQESVAAPVVPEDTDLIKSTEDIKKTPSDDGVKDGETLDETTQIVAQIMEKMKTVQIMAPQKDVRVLDAQLKAASVSPTSEETALTDETQSQKAPEKDVIQTQEASEPPSLGSETKTQIKWTAGSRCRAVFSDDGMAYPAVVLWVKGDRCRIRYEKYDNEEELNVSCLLSPNELHGPRRTYPLYQAGDRPSRSRYKTDTHPGDGRNSQRKPVANPVTPQPVTTAPDSSSYNTHLFSPPTLSAMEDGGSDADIASLSGMLQAWYMCGYRTGRYMVSVPCNCPPLPPPLLAMEHGRDIDAAVMATLSTTLQAWYMCGYRTGRYMTLLQRD